MGEQEHFVRRELPTPKYTLRTYRTQHQVRQERPVVHYVAEKGQRKVYQHHYYTHYEKVRTQGLVKQMIPETARQRIVEEHQVVDRKATAERAVKVAQQQSIGEVHTYVAGYTPWVKGTSHVVEQSAPRVIQQRWQTEPMQKEYRWQKVPTSLASVST